jgi:hypothetical protein
MQIKENFAENFFGDPENDTRKEGKKPTNIADALRDMRDFNFPMWNDMANSVFFKSGDELTIQEALDMVIETNDCDGAETPVGVYIDPAGKYQIDVFDDIDNEYESVCCYCGKIMRIGQKKTSHGICRECYDKKMKCGNCGEQLEDEWYSTSGIDKMFCSEKCLNEFKNKSKEIKNNPFKTGKPISSDRQCKCCGRYFPEGTHFVSDNFCLPCWSVKKIRNAPWRNCNEVLLLYFYLSKERFPNINNAKKWASKKGIYRSKIIDTKDYWVFPQYEHIPDEINDKKFNIGEGIIVSYIDKPTEDQNTWKKV